VVFPGSATYYRQNIKQVVELKRLGQLALVVFFLAYSQIVIYAET
jgi:hypothetical protein